MKSIKPGRGPSGMNFIGSLFGVVFGIIWTFITIHLGAPIFFPLFGLCFIGLGIFQAIYHYRNATGKNRYSSFDITDESEEPDPLEQRFGGSRGEPHPDSPYHTRDAYSFCPYCGTDLSEDFEFCPKCGKRLPK